MNILNFISNILTKKSSTKNRKGINILEYLPNAMATIFEEKVGRKPTEKELSKIINPIIKNVKRTPNHSDSTPYIYEPDDDEKIYRISLAVDSVIGSYCDFKRRRLISSLDKHFEGFRYNYEILLKYNDHPQYHESVNSAIYEIEANNLFDEIHDKDFIIKLVHNPTEFDINEIYRYHASRINSKIFNQ